MKIFRLIYLYLTILMMVGTGCVYGQNMISYDWSKCRAIVARSTLDGCYYALYNSLDAGKMAASRVVVLNGKVVCPEKYRKPISWISNFSSSTDKYGVTTRYVTFYSSLQEYLAYSSSSSSGFDLGSSIYKWVLDNAGIRAVNGLEDEDKESVWYIKLYDQMDEKHFNVKTSVKLPNASLYKFAGDDDGFLRSGLQSGSVGTVCLDRTVDSVSVIGAKFYSVVGKYVDETGAPTSLVLGQESKGLVAGRPYIYVANDTMLAVAYSDNVKVTAAGSYHGLYGVLDDTCYVADLASDNIYAITGNKIKKAGVGSYIGANRAYIDMDEVPVMSAVSSVKGLVDFPLDGEFTGIADFRQAPIVGHSLSCRSLIAVPVTSHIYVKGGKKYLK